MPSFRKYIDDVKNNEGHSRLWAVLGGMAAVVALPVTIIAIIVQIATTGANKPAPAPGPGTIEAAPPSVVTTMPGNLSPAPAASTAPPAGTSRFTGRITLHAGATGDEVDLDKVPPSKTTEEADNDVLVEVDMRSDAGDVSDFDGSALIAKWDGDGVPGFPECKVAGTAQGITTVTEVKLRSILCVKTSEGRTARLTATRVAKFNSITFDTVVWDG